MEQDYIIGIDNEDLGGGSFRVFQIDNNREIEVTSRAAKLILFSDANYQIILKIDAGSSSSAYGVEIEYANVRMPYSH